MRLRTILLAIVGVVVVAVGGLAVFVSQVDPNAYRGQIAEQAKAFTGRDLAINGDLKLSAFSFTPSIDVNNVTFANAPWGSRLEMAKVGRFELQLELMPLLSRQIVVKRIVLNQADILLETDTKGQGNWEFGTPGAAPTPTAPASAAGAGAPGVLPTVNEIEIRDAKLIYRDGTKKGRDAVLSLARATVRADSATAPLKIDVDGAFNALKIQVAGQLGAASALMQPGSAPFPVDVTGKLGDVASFKAKGQIREPAAGKGYEMAISAEGTELAKLAELGGQKMAAFGPFKLDVQINDQAPGGGPSVASIKGELGKVELVHVRLDGAVKDPLNQKGIALNVTIEGREVGALSGFTLPGATRLPPVPALGPFKGTLKIANGAGDKPTVPELKFELGKADLLRLVIAGAIQDPMAAKGVKIDVNLDAPDMVKLAALAGTAPPVEGPLKLEAELSDTGSNKYAVKDLKLSVGPGDLAGEATIDIGGAKPVVTANLSSNQIDISKLGDGPATPAPAAPASDRMFSNDPLPFDQLNIADANIRFAAKKLVTPKGTMQNVNITVALKGGELNVKPLALEFGGGKINGEVQMAARNQAFATKMEVRGFKSGDTLREMKITDYIKGAPTDVTVDVRGNGRSMRALMASLDGVTTVVVGDGIIDSRLYDIIGADLVKLINPTGKQSEGKLNCVVQRFEIKDGLATSKVLVSDTNSTTVIGEGTVNLGTEKQDLLFDQKPKDTSLFGLVPPIRVGGTFADPSFLPDAAGTALGVAKTLGTTALMANPVGLAAGLIGGNALSREPEDPCRAALAQVGINRPAAAAPPAPTAPAGARTPAQTPTQTRPGQPAQQQPQQRQQQPQQQQQQQQPGGAVERGLRGLLGN
jgi:uncharacterized protein involved in outer membrane biogenesis